MKKFLLSSAVIVVFVIYAVYQNATNASYNSLASSAGVPATQTPASSSGASASPPAQTPPQPASQPAGTSTSGTSGASSSNSSGGASTVTTPPPQPHPAPSQPAPAPAPTPAPAPRSMYADGTYTGSVADAYYGLVQVQVAIQGGKVTSVDFLQYPNDRSTSRFINGLAMPYLKQEAIQAQNADVNIVSGATDTSLAFRQSLSAALLKAKNS